MTMAATSRQLEHVQYPSLEARCPHLADDFFELVQFHSGPALLRDAQIRRQGQEADLPLN
jgi:hypothetical protein